MPDYTGSARTVVPAPAADVFDLMLEPERLPSWMRAVRSARTLTRDPAGRAHEVAYEVELLFITAHYTLRHDYRPPERITSVAVAGDFRALEGEWSFAERSPTETAVRFELLIDPGRIVPRPIVRLVNRQVVRGSLEDLRRHFAAGPQ